MITLKLTTEITKTEILILYLLEFLKLTRLTIVNAGKNTTMRNEAY